MKSAYEQLKEDEGFSGTVYKDTAGKNTIGYGRNLDDNPLTPGEAAYLLQCDLKKVRRLAKRFPFYDSMNSARKNVILMMIFNMGIGSFNGFRNMITALYVSDYETAADEMLDSKWHRKLKELGSDRAYRLSEIMRNGE